jgi:hypothetical protein
MKSRKSIYSILFCSWVILTPLLSNAQFNPSYISNHTTANAMLLNPASIADPRTYFDGVFIGVGASAYNNFVYLAKEDYNLFRGEFPAKLSNKETTGRISAQIEAEVTGPSFAIVKDYITIGFSTRQRTYFSSRGTPYEIGKLAIEGIDYEPLQNIDSKPMPFYLKGMSWSEIGGHIGFIINENAKDMLTGGVAMKALIGQGLIGANFFNFDHNINEGTLEVHDFTGSYAYATPGMNRGMGLGFDIGLMYKKMRKDVTYHRPHSVFNKCRRIDYKYKFGVSLIDVGYINFKKNSGIRSFSDASATWTDVKASNLGSLRLIDKELEKQFSPDSGNVNFNNSFRAVLPTALSLQFENAYSSTFFLNTTLFLGVPRINKMGAERSSWAAITPRYETDNFEIAAPLTIAAYSSPRVGLMIRAYNFLIGTNNIFPFTGLTNVSGFDVYFQLRIYLTKSPKCRLIEEEKNWWCPDCDDKEKL